MMTPCSSCPLCVWNEQYRQALQPEGDGETVDGGNEPLRDWLRFRLSYKCAVLDFSFCTSEAASADGQLLDSLVEAIQRDGSVQRLGISLLLTLPQTQDNPPRRVARETEELQQQQHAAIVKLQRIHNKVQKLSLYDLPESQMDAVAQLLQENSSVVETLELHPTDLHQNFGALVSAIEQCRSLQTFVFSSVLPPSDNDNVVNDDDVVEEEEEADLPPRWQHHPPVPTQTVAVTTEVKIVGLLEAVLRLHSLRSLQFGNNLAEEQQQRQPKSKVPFQAEILASAVQHIALAELSFLNCTLTEEQALGIAQGFREECALELFVSPNGHADLSDNACFSMGSGPVGLQTLSFKGTVLSDEGLAALAHSLCGHATLRCINLEETTPGRRGNLTSLEEYDRFNARKMTRTNYILELLRWNPVVEQVHFTLSERDEGVYQKLAFFLDINRRGLRRLKTSVSRSVWGSAVIAFRNESDSSCRFMMLRMRPDLVMTSPVSPYNSYQGGASNTEMSGAAKKEISPLSSLSRWKSLLGKAPRKILNAKRSVTRVVGGRKFATNNNNNKQGKESNVSRKTTRTLIEC